LYKKDETQCGIPENKGVLCEAAFSKRYAGRELYGSWVDDFVPLPFVGFMR